MRRFVLLLFGLGLLLSAMAPAIEPLDRWDHTPTAAADTEFHVVAFAIGVGLAALVLLVSRHGLRGLRFFVAVVPALTLLGAAFCAGVETVRVNGPPVSPPLRI